MSDSNSVEKSATPVAPPAQKAPRRVTKLIAAVVGVVKHASSSSTSVPTNSTADLARVTTAAGSAALLSSASTFVNAAPQTRTFDFVVEERVGAPDGVDKTMLVVNGQYPGPTIEVGADDRVVVNVTNKLPNSTRNTNFYDGSMAITQCGIPPGESMVYNFTLDGYVGTTWWHSHAGTQYTDGITGALVVHSKNESVPVYDGDLVLQLADLYHTLSPALLNLYFTPGGLEGTPGNEPVPDGGSINGVGQWGSHNSSFFNITLEANKTYRLRLVNTGSFVAMQFAVDNHTLTVIEADGTAVDPIEVSSVSVAVAQRYSVLLRTNQTAGAYWIRADAFTYDNPGVQTEVRGVIRYGVDDSVMPDTTLLDNPPGLADTTLQELNTDDLVPVGEKPVPDSTFSFYFTISMQYASGPNYLSQFLSFINSTSWEPLEKTSSLYRHLGNKAADGSAVLADSNLITTVNEVHVVDMVIDNLDDGDHPFHLHGHKFWIMGSGAGRFQNQTLTDKTPMLRDTLVIPAYTWTVLRFVGDNPGFWAFHCHIQWHMLNMLPSQSSAFDIPQYMLDQCARS
ncbi:Cupredoxin [Epithele typhae]|uniref:Cupredoxin n=1 Tax=Epithele typhae TaxID=378194 RepID=UPI0020087FAC|nr:Cupredoxin [Epithele typhae]KAH9927903.1 Cupredoxin [Epithele typhae]